MRGAAVVGDNLSVASPKLQTADGGQFMDQVDIAWLAAWIDADGWINNREIGIRITDKDILERIKSITGVGSLFWAGEGVNRELWEWRVYNAPDKARLSLAIYPMMSDRRKQEIAELAEHMATQKTSRCAPLFHGTTRMYRWELREGIPTCDQCRSAEAAEALNRIRSKRNANDEK